MTERKTIYSSKIEYFGEMTFVSFLQLLDGGIEARLTREGEEGDAESVEEVPVELEEREFALISFLADAEGQLNDEQNAGVCDGADRDQGQVAQTVDALEQTQREDHEHREAQDVVRSVILSCRHFQILHHALDQVGNYTLDNTSY